MVPAQMAESPTFGVIRKIHQGKWRVPAPPLELGRRESLQPP